MFEDYRVQTVQKFKCKVEYVCLSDRGVIIIQEKRMLMISHLKGCDEPIELFRYFKEQLGFHYQICHGLVEFPSFSSQKQSVCFGIIMDYDLWCVIVKVNLLQRDKIEVQIEQLKMLATDVESKGSALRFIGRQRRNLIVLTQWTSENEVNLIEVIPQKHHIDTLSINRVRKLQFGWENQPPLEQLPNFRSKSLIFAIYSNYVLVYNQLASENEDSHLIFIYGLDSSLQIQENKTFPRHIIVLPGFQQPRMISHIELVPTDQAMSLKQSIILCFYQLPSGLEIVQTDFTHPSTIKRKYLYQQLQFSEFIYSSITLKLIQVKGIEYCLENHSILIRSQEGFGQNCLVLLNLPSTGSPKISSKVPTEQYFNTILVRQAGFWILQPLALKQVHRISKMEIYQMILRYLGAKCKNNLDCICKEFQSLLE